MNVDILLGQIKQVEDYIEFCDVTLQKTIGLAEQLSDFRLIQSIPVIGENLCTRILDEIGDTRRIKGPEKLVAFAEIDPIIYQHCKNEGCNSISPRSVINGCGAFSISLHRAV